MMEFDSGAGRSKGELFEVGGREGYVGAYRYAGTVDRNGQPATSGLGSGSVAAWSIRWTCCEDRNRGSGRSPGGSDRGAGERGAHGEIGDGKSCLRYC